MGGSDKRPQGVPTTTRNGNRCCPFLRDGVSTYLPLQQEVCICRSRSRLCYANNWLPSPVEEFTWPKNFPRRRWFPA